MSMDKTRSCMDKTEKTKFPFIDPDMAEDEYFGLPYASNSILKMLLDRSPAHARYALDNPSEDTAPAPAKAFGRVFHAVLLESGNDLVAVKPAGADRSSNLAKRRLLQWMEELTGAKSHAGADFPEGKMLSARIAELESMLAPYTICTQADWDLAQRMRDSVLSRSIGRAIFEDGKPEVSMGAELLGVKVKSRMDWLPTDHHMIADLKSADDSAWDAFSRAVGRYGYARQAALYRRIYRAATGSRSEPAFVFVTVEKTAPFDVGFYELDDDSIRRANDQIDTALAIWGRCEEADIWPGTGWDWNNNEYTIQEIYLPKWA